MAKREDVQPADAGETTNVAILDGAVVVPVYAEMISRLGWFEHG